MAHYQQHQFVLICREHFPDHFKSKEVLEVGSCDINGSIRKLFTSCCYIGVDIAAGPNVDLVCFGQDVSFESNYFDVAISCECFEHNEYWIETFSNMIRMLKPGGVCIITCASIGRGEHGTSRCVPHYSLTAEVSGGNYYKNLDVSDFRRTGLLKNFTGFRFVRNIYAKDIYFIGIKKGDPLPQGIVRLLDCISDKASLLISEKPLPLSKIIDAQLRWIARYALSKLVGEKRYHDIVFFLKHQQNVGER
ncbi:class I SAM-dependent methyltransferase [uncultured Thiodictyon sp.]|uniref:class I SAM-dependent methyltransferase n=1 Tax=uncultured Thiodictyon sp. TaxID=1846217 RepID=UPI0025F7C817|nr:class I SAM-dependent methyltransferase [uncultured Thiodictyon sp.]